MVTWSVESRTECLRPVVFFRLLQVLHRVSSSLLGPVAPSFRALSGRLKFTVRRHKFNTDLIAGSIHDEYDFGVSKDGYKTIVYLKFIYTLKIDQNLRQNSIRSYSL